MKKLSLLYLFSLFTTYIIASDIYVMPTTSSWYRFGSYIDNLEIEITPDGHRARVELTFTIYVDSINPHPYNYNSTLPTYRDANLEAFLNFYLPSKDAYFYDSYLWLNPSTIIRAKLISRNEANWIYDSIVNRQKDPSILQRGWNNNYTLNVFPISTTYSRKVKLAYSTLLDLSSSNIESIDLPKDIIQLARPSSTSKIIINNGNGLNAKRIVFYKSDSSMQELPSQSVIEVSNNLIMASNKVLLEYQNTSNAGVISFQSQKLNPNEGFYDIRINTLKISNLVKDVSAYIIKIPMKNSGFCYQKFNNSENKLSTGKFYNECGLFFGEIDATLPIELGYKVGDNFHQISYSIGSNQNSDYLYQNWTHYFAQNIINQESKEASLKYRVLTDQTAFLALENGDTVTTTKNNSMVDNSRSTASITATTNPAGISVYPNPIAENFAISSETAIKGIKIFDISGKLIFEKIYDKHIKVIQLNSTELTMTKGLYWITIETKDVVRSIKVWKE